MEFNNDELLTENEATLVMTILLDNLIDLKNNKGFDDYGTSLDLENAVNKLDNLFIKLGYTK